MKLSRTWLSSYIENIPSAEELAELLTNRLTEVESVEGDLIDLNVLPNRAHDLLSHQGVAREIAGILGVPFKDPEGLYRIPDAIPTQLVVDVETKQVRRYMARIIRGVRVGPSPDWVVRYLESIGQKSINNIVDATNIVMYDSGGPTHVFDLKKLKGSRIVVREAKAEEEVSLLGGEVVSVIPGDTIITDGSHILALGGVKGGTVAEVDEHTTDIVIEVANFDPQAVRRTARRLRLLTDAAKRFENDLSPSHGDYTMKQLSALMYELFPDAVFEEVVDIYSNPQQERVVRFSLTKLNTILGVSLLPGEVDEILTKYGFSFAHDADTYQVTVSPLRLDLTDACDLIEEVGRLYGYEKIPALLPDAIPTVPENTSYKAFATTREKYLQEGYHEVMTYSFCKKGDIVVARGPKGKDALRTNLADGLKEAYEKNRLNAPLLGLNTIKLFEIGTVFFNDTEVIHGATIDAEGVSENTLKVEEVSFTERPIEEGVFMEWSAYPFIVRDIAFWSHQEIDATEIIDLLTKEGEALLARPPVLFDTFSKDGKTSYAFRMVFQSYEKTLTDAEVDALMERITEELKNRSFEVR